VKVTCLVVMGRFRDTKAKGVGDAADGFPGGRTEADNVIPMNHTNKAAAIGMLRLVETPNPH